MNSVLTVDLIKLIHIFVLYIKIKQATSIPKLHNFIKNINTFFLL